METRTNSLKTTRLKVSVSFCPLQTTWRTVSLWIRTSVSSVWIRTSVSVSASRASLTPALALALDEILCVVLPAPLGTSLVAEILTQSILKEEGVSGSQSEDTRAAWWQGYEAGDLIGKQRGDA